MTEMQCFLLMLLREKHPVPLYIAGHVSLADYIEEGGHIVAMRDPRKGEDLRSVLKKLSRMVERGWVRDRGMFFSITDSGLAALKSTRAQVMIQRLRKHWADNQAKEAKK